MRKDLHRGSGGVPGAQSAGQRNLAHALTAAAHRPFAPGAVPGILVTAAALRHRPEGILRRRGDVR